jgi:hypothetical protein
VCERKREREREREIPIILKKFTEAFQNTTRHPMKYAFVVKEFRFYDGSTVVRFVF